MSQTVIAIFNCRRHQYGLGGCCLFGTIPVVMLIFADNGLFLALEGAVSADLPRRLVPGSAHTTALEHPRIVALPNCLVFTHLALTPCVILTPSGHEQDGLSDFWRGSGARGLSQLQSVGISSRFVQTFRDPHQMSTLIIVDSKSTPVFVPHEKDFYVYPHQTESQPFNNSSMAPPSTITVALRITASHSQACSNRVKRALTPDGFRSHTTPREPNCLATRIAPRSVATAHLYQCCRYSLRYCR
ncbi:hypothetical protein J6590_061552 [Homalodisca vitripennis]|nr:hypothetical protein J6590_061552 [Homalodisca vitripennis]